jgi:hypothetical protein
MGKKSKARGASYERKIAQIFNKFFEWNLRRNLEQSRDVHGDLLENGNQPVPHNIIIECRRREFSWETLISWQDEIKNSVPAWITEYVSENPGKNVLLVFRNPMSPRDFAAYYYQTDIPLHKEVAEELNGFESGQLLLADLSSMMAYIKCVFDKLKMT